MTTMATKTSAHAPIITGNGKNGTLIGAQGNPKEDKNGGSEQETANLITIEATQDMIKVESHQL